MENGKYKMEISVKTMVIVLLSIGLFLWLNDTFQQPEFKNDAIKYLGKMIDNTTTHTFLEWSTVKSSQLAGAISISVGFILNLFPVSLIF